MALSNLISAREQNVSKEASMYFFLIPTLMKTHLIGVIHILEIIVIRDNER